MAHYAILSPPDAGHLYPLGNVGVELQRRGHRVTIIAHERGAPLAEQLGLGFRPLDAEHIDAPLSPLLVDWAFRLVGHVDQIGIRDWLRWEAEVVLQVVPQILTELAIDGLLIDQILTAGGTAADRVGVPFVTGCTAPPWNEDPWLPPPFTSWQYKEGALARLRNRLGYAGWRWFNWPTLQAINRYRRQWQLAPYRSVGDFYSQLAQITQLFAEFDFPRRRIPPHFHYVGALAADRPVREQDFPWDRLDGRPLVYASLGTIAEPMNRPVYPKIAAACVGLDVQLVMARGNWDDDEEGREDTHELPGDLIVVDFAPQLALLDRASVLITHCGLNTTLESVSRGVPIVGMPRNADQPGNASRIAYSGMGLLGSFHGGTPEGLRRVIERVLKEDRFRLRARELQQAMRSAGGVSRAADIVEAACTTRQPVLNDQCGGGSPHSFGGGW